MKEPTYVQLSQELSDCKTKYRNMLTGDNMPLADIKTRERLMKDIYRIDAELKKIDKAVGQSYKSLCGSYHTDYKIPTSKASLILKGMIFIGVAALIIIIITL